MGQALEMAPLTAAEVEALDTLYRTTTDRRVRLRAHIVLLAGEQGMTVSAIARIVRETGQTVRNWFKRDAEEVSSDLQRARAQMLAAKEALRRDVAVRTDWREWVRRKPALFYGGAFAVGFLIGTSASKAVPLLLGTLLREGAKD